MPDAAIRGQRPNAGWRRSQCEAVHRLLASGPVALTSLNQLGFAPEDSHAKPE